MVIYGKSPGIRLSGLSKDPLVSYRNQLYVNYWDFVVVVCSAHTIIDGIWFVETPF